MIEVLVARAAFFCLFHQIPGIAYRFSIYTNTETIAPTVTATASQRP